MQGNFREIVEALIPFLQALDRFQIRYYVGGSVASSYYGTWRRTQDVDVILDVRPDQIRTLANLLAQDYLIDKDAWIDAFRHSQPYNIFYEPTFTKIDVMPLQTAHQQEEARRAQPHLLLAGSPPIRLSSARRIRFWQSCAGISRWAVHNASGAILSVSLSGNNPIWISDTCAHGQIP
jgi:hypothetical protein